MADNNNQQTPKWPDLYGYAKELFGAKQGENNQRLSSQDGGVVDNGGSLTTQSTTTAQSATPPPTETATTGTVVEEAAPPTDTTSGQAAGTQANVAKSGAVSTPKQNPQVAQPQDNQTVFDLDDEELMKIRNGNLDDVIKYTNDLYAKVMAAYNDKNISDEEYSKMEAHYNAVAKEVKARAYQHNKEANEFAKAEQEHKRVAQEAEKKKQEAAATGKRKAAENASYVNSWYQTHQPGKGQSDTMTTSNGFAQGAAASKGKTDEEVAVEARKYIEENSGVKSDSAIRDYVSGVIIGNNIRKEYGDKINWNLEGIDSLVLGGGADVSKEVKEEFIKIRRGDYRGATSNTYRDTLSGALKVFEDKYVQEQDRVTKNARQHFDVAAAGNKGDNLALYGAGVQAAGESLTGVDLKRLINNALGSVPKARMTALSLALSKNFIDDSKSGGQSSFEKAADFISNEFVKACLHKVSADFDNDTSAVIVGGLANTILGGIMQAGFRVAGGGNELTRMDAIRNTLEERAAQWGKDGGWGYAKIAAKSATMMLGDAPIFGAIGKAAGGLSKAFLQKVSLKMLPSAMRSAEVGEQLFRGLQMTRSGRAIIGTSNGMFTGMIYSPLSYTTGTLASGGDWSLSEAASSAARGGVEFGGMGAMGAIMNYGADKILRKVSGTGKGATAVRVATNIVAKDILTPGANAAFTTALAGFSGEIQESLGSYYAEKFGEFLGMHAAGKIQAGKHGLNEYRVKTSLNESAFTKAEIESLGYKSFKGLINDLLYRQNGDEGGKVEFGNGGSVEIKGRVNAEKLKTILENENIPWTAKAKVLTFLAGDGSAIATPTITFVGVAETTNAKGKTVKMVITFGSNGEFVSCSDEFSDAKAAEDEANRLRDISYKNSVTIAEGHKNAKWGDVAHKYALLQVTAKFGDVEVSASEVEGLVDRVLDKQQKGEQLDKTEKRIYETYRDAYTKELLSPTADTAINVKRAFKERVGVDIDEILKKKYYEWTAEEKTAVEDYIEILTGDKELPSAKREQAGGSNGPTPDAPQGETPEEPTDGGETPPEVEGNGGGGEPPIEDTPKENVPKTKEDLLNEVDVEDLIKARNVDDEMADEIRGDKDTYSEELETLRGEAADAIDYANGEKAEKPNSWEYWKEKFGLQEPKHDEQHEPTRAELIGQVGVEDYIATENVGDDKEFADEVRNNPDAFSDEVKALQEDASLAFDYADGTSADKPKHWEYWCDKFGLKDPEPKGPDGGGEPPQPPTGGGNPPDVERPTIPDTDPKGMTDEDISKELSTLQEYQDKMPNAFGEDLATRKAALESEIERRTPEGPKVGDELVVEHDGHPVTIVVDNVGKDGRITKSHVRGDKERPYHSRGKVVYERTPEEIAADRAEKLNGLSSAEFSGDEAADDKTLNDALAEMDKIGKEAKTDKEKQEVAEHRQKIITNFVTASTSFDSGTKSHVSVHGTTASMTESVVDMKGMDNRKRGKVVAATLANGEIHINAGSSALKTAKDVRDAMSHETTHVFNQSEEGSAVVKEIAESYTRDELLGFLGELAGKQVAKSYKEIMDGAGLPDKVQRKRLADEITAFYSQHARDGKAKETKNKELNDKLKRHNNAYNTAVKDGKLYDGRHNTGGIGADGGLPQGAPGGNGNGRVLGVGFGGGRGDTGRGSEKHRRGIAELDEANKGKSVAEVLDGFLAKPSLSKDEAELADAYADKKIAEANDYIGMAKSHGAPQERIAELEKEKAELEEKRKQIKKRANKDKSETKGALAEIEDAVDEVVGKKNRDIVAGVAQALGMNVKVYDGEDKDELGRIEGATIFINSQNLLAAPDFAVGAMLVCNMGESSAKTLFGILFGGKTPFDKGRLAGFIGNSSTRKTARSAMLSLIGSNADNRSMLIEFKDCMTKALELAYKKSGAGTYSEAAKVVGETVDAVLSEMEEVKGTSEDTTKAYSDLFGESPKRKISKAAAKSIAPLLERYINIKKKFDEWKAANTPKPRKPKASDKGSLEERHKNRLEKLNKNKGELEKDIAALEKEIDKLQRGEYGGLTSDENGVPNIDNTESKIRGKKSELATKRRLLESTNAQIEDAPKWLEKQRQAEERRKAIEEDKAAAIEDFGEEQFVEDNEMDFAGMSSRDQQKELDNRRKEAEIEKKLSEVRDAIDRAIEDGGESNSLVDAANEAAGNDAANGAMFLLGGNIGAMNHEDVTGKDTISSLFDKADDLDFDYPVRKGLSAEDVEKRKNIEGALNEEGLKPFMDNWVYEFADGDFVGGFRAFKNKIGAKKSEADRETAPLLSDVWENETLYQMYPSFRDIKVFLTAGSLTGEAGHYDPVNKELHVSLSYSYDITGKWGQKMSKTAEFTSLEVKRTVAHELQHAIQFEENWALGGNEYTPEVVKYAMEKTQAIVDVAAGIIQSKRFSELFDRKVGVKKIKNGLSENTQVELGELNKFIVDEIKSNDIYQRYRHVLPQVREAIIAIIGDGAAKYGEDGLFHVDAEELDLFCKDHDLAQKGSKAGPNSPIFSSIVGNVDKKMANNLPPVQWTLSNTAKNGYTGNPTIYVDSALQGYKSLTGEVQARMVEERVGWTKEQREKYGLEYNRQKYSDDFTSIDDAGGNPFKPAKKGGESAADAEFRVYENHIPENDRISVFPKSEDKERSDEAKELFGDNGAMFSLSGKDYGDTHDDIEKVLGAQLPKDATVDDIDAEIDNLKKLRTEANKEYLSGQPHSDVAKEDASNLRKRLIELNAEKAKKQEKQRKEDLESKVVSLTTKYLAAKGRGDMAAAEAAAKEISAAKKQIESSSMRGKYRAKVSELKQKFDNVGDVATSLAKYINSELQPILAKEMGKKEFTTLLNTVRDIAKAWNAKEGDAADKHTLTNKLDEAVRKVDDTIVGIEIRNRINEVANLLKTKTTKRDSNGKKVGVKVSNDVRVAIETMCGFLDGLNPNSEVAKLLKPFMSAVNEASDDMRQNRKEARALAKERAELEEKLNNGSISQDDYNNESARLDAEEQRIRGEKDTAEQRHEDRLDELSDAIKSMLPRTIADFDKLEQELEQKFLDEQNGVRDMTLHEKALYNALPFVRSMVDVSEYIHEVEANKARVKSLEDQLKADVPNPSDTRQEATDRADRRLKTSLDLAQAKMDLSASRAAARNRLGDYVTEVRSLLETGKTQYAEWQKRKVERRKEVVRIGIGAVNTGKSRPEGVAGQQAAEKDKAKSQNFMRRLWNWLFLRPTESAESMLSRIDVNHFATEGDLYNLFMASDRGFVQSQDRKFSSISELRKTVKGKCKEIFGKKEPTGRTDRVKFTQTFTTEEVDSATGNTITATHTVDTDMTKGEALSVYLWSLSEKGRAKLEQQGIDQYAIGQIKAGLGADWLEFGDWIVKDFLPKLYEKYNVKYTEKYGTELTQNENYFPWRIYGGDIITKDDLESFDNGGALPQPSALKERTSHNYDLSMTSDALNILNDHIAEMEDWYHFADMREDISSLLSSRAFREMVNMRNPNMYNRFKDAMHVMAGMRVDSENVTSQVLNEVQRNLATSAISFRFWTALKQLQSTIAGMNYSLDPRFQLRIYSNLFLPVGTSLLTGKFKSASNLTAGMLGSCYWAWKNSPQFRNRLIEGQMGNAMLEYESSIGRGAGWYKTSRDFVARLGMAPNKAFDAMAVAIYMKSIYDYKYSRLIKQGLTPEEAHKQAMIEAENNYNKTQQSSLLAYMSPMQVSNNPVEKGLTTFQTASLGFARKTINHVDDIFRAYRLMRTGKEKPLHCIGKVGKATIDTLWDGFVMPASWNMLNVVGFGGFYAGVKSLISSLFGDDDDKALEKDANGKTALDRFAEDHHDDTAFALLTAPLQGTVLNNIVNTYWAGRGNWTPTMGESAFSEVLKSFADLTAAWKNNGKTIGENLEDLDEDAAKYTAKAAVYFLFKTGTALDFKTVERLYNSFVDRKAEGLLFPFDNFVSAANFLSSPMSNLKGQEAREYYLGGYGKNSETATSLEDYLGKRAYADGKIFAKDAKDKGAVVKFMRETAHKKDLNKYVDEWVNYHIKDAIDATAFHDEWINSSERKKIRQQNNRLEISNEDAKAKEDSLKVAMGYDQKTGNSERTLRHNIVTAIVGKIKDLLTGGDKDRKKAFDAMSEVERIDARPNHTHGDYIKLAKELGVKDWTMMPREITSSGRFANASDVESGKISRDEIQGAYNLWATRDDSKADTQFNKIKRGGEPYIAKTKSILEDYAKGRISRGAALNKILEMGDNVPMAFYSKEVADAITKYKGALSKAVKAGNDMAAKQILTEIRRLRSKVLEHGWNSKSNEEVAKALLSMAKQ